MFIHGTSVSNNDSDGDGISDGEELAFNSDPLDGNTNYGDINLDGEFNVGDYVVLMQFVLGTRLPNPTEQEQADINQDGVLNVQDLLLMQRVLLGLQLSWFDFSAEGLSEVFSQFYQNIIPSAYAANGDGDIYFIHNDHLGTPVKMTNELGFVVWSAVYDPFGKATVNEDVDGDGFNVGMNVRFPGQYYDGESGLHYNYFRIYDPELGRYITSDPIGLLGGVNTFGYVGANPLFWVDSLGLAKNNRNGGGRVNGGANMYLLGSGWNTVRQQNINNRRFERRQYQNALRRLAEQNRTNIINPINISQLPNSNENIRNFITEIGNLLPPDLNERIFIDELNKRNNAPLACR